jgi:hypothetical protein
LLIAHLPYFEGAEVSGHRKPVDVDQFYACARRALAQVYEEGLKNGLVALGVDLDRPIWAITDPAENTQPAGFVRGGRAVPDALHPPGNDRAKALHDARSEPLGSTLQERRRGVRER